MNSKSSEASASKTKDGVPSKPSPERSIFQTLSYFQRMMLRPPPSWNCHEWNVLPGKSSQIRKKSEVKSNAKAKPRSNSSFINQGDAMTDPRHVKKVQMPTEVGGKQIIKNKKFGGEDVMEPSEELAANHIINQKNNTHSDSSSQYSCKGQSIAGSDVPTQTSSGDKICVQKTVYTEKVDPSKHVFKNGKPVFEVKRIIEWRIPERYQTKQLIGSGSYGHVCEAFDTYKKRVVAIKKVHRVFEDLIDCKRILREISILNRLNHSNVVKILDLIVPQDLQKFDELYVVLEIADSDFKKLFKSSIHLSQLHVATLLYNLLVGIKYVHSVGIFHRDLKPANCLVNQDCSVKICDFGLARTVRSADDNAGSAYDMSDDSEMLDFRSSRNLKRQLTGHVVTRWYRAPELILLQERYTEAIDVWSIGCIFAELLGMLNDDAKASERCPLFPGSSCFPLSPEHKDHRDNINKDDDSFYSRGNRDQLNMIFNVIGTPSTKDIATVERLTSRKYLEYFHSRPGANLAAKFPKASEDAIDLLKRMLIFNPQKRITVDDALAHKLFDQLRPEQPETQNAFEKVQLPFDDWQSMNEPQLRYAFLKEIQLYHSDMKIPANSPFLSPFPTK